MSGLNIPIGKGIALLGCLGLLTLTATVGIGTAIADSGSGEHETHEVTVTTSGLVFIPDDLTINVGDTVYFYWINTSMDHNVAESSSSGSNEYLEGGFRSGEVEPTVHFNVTFDEVGTFYYICEPHATMGMKGVITVVDPNAEPIVNDEAGEKVPGFLASLSIVALAGAAIISSRNIKD